MNFWLLFLVHLFAVMSPGPDLFLILRNSSIHSRRESLIISFGIACGCLIHMVTVIIIVYFIGGEIEWISRFLRILGSGYLIYLGLSSLNSFFQIFPERSRANKNNFKNQKKSTEFGDENQEKIHNPEFKTYFLKGLFCNLLNPKVWAYFSSIFFSITLELSPPELVLVVFMFFIITQGWFSLVTVLLTLPFFQLRFNRYSRIMPLLCGIAFTFFGVSLILN